jgi:hypothetical protein
VLKLLLLLLLVVVLLLVVLLLQGELGNTVYTHMGLLLLALACVPSCT